MIVFIITFIIAFLANLYIVIFGKKDLQVLKEKISIRKYLEEIDGTLKQMIGDGYTRIVKIVMVVLAIAFVIFNAFAFLLALVGVVLGTFAAKKSYGVPFINNWLSKVATYINRLR